VQVRGPVAGDGGRALIVLSVACPRDGAARRGLPRADLILRGIADRQLPSVDIAMSLERHVEFPDVAVPSLPVALDGPDDGGPERAARLVREMRDTRTGPQPVVK
jgi:hypothetical protein